MEKSLCSCTWLLESNLIKIKSTLDFFLKVLQELMKTSFICLYIKYAYIFYIDPKPGIFPNRETQEMFLLKSENRQRSPKLSLILFII